LEALCDFGPGVVSKHFDVIKAHLLQLYVFADVYSISALRLAVMEQWQDLDRRLSKGRYLPSINVIREAFERLPHTSPLCQYMIQLAVHCWKSLQAADLSRMPPDLISDASHSVRRLRASINADRTTTPAASRGAQMPKLPFDSSRACEFHEHATEQGSLVCQKKLVLHLRLQAVTQRFLWIELPQMEAQAQETKRKREQADEAGRTGLSAGAQGTTTQRGS